MSILLSLIGMHGLGLGQWSSDNESVLSINRISGEAHAHGEGSAQGMKFANLLSLVYIL